MLNKLFYLAIQMKLRILLKLGHNHLFLYLIIADCIHKVESKYQKIETIFRIKFEI